MLHLNCRRPVWRRLRACLIGLIAAPIVATGAQAEDLTVAVAANFLIPLRALETDFEASTGYQIAVTSGSTGQLYAQIVNGAPYDILLAADQERPRLLAERGLGDPESVFTYAVGQLALWSADSDRVRDETVQSLLEIEFRWFAIPEPNVAPYGAAARQALESLGAWSSLEPKIVKGQNVAQTFAMIATGNAELGLIALSQALAYDGTASFRIVPAALHKPIRQDAILLEGASENTAAREFLEFLKTTGAAETMERHGYAAL